MQLSRLTPNIMSALYLLLSGIKSERYSLWVVAFKVNTACSTLILHISLRSSDVVFVCLYDENKVFWTFILYGSMGASGAESFAWFGFLLVALMSFATVLLHCSSLISATIAWSDVIRTLATNHSLNSWVSNMVSSSNTVICSSKVLNVTFVCDTLRDPISSCR